MLSASSGAPLAYCRNQYIILEFLLRLREHYATVDHDGLAGHVVGVFGGQVRYEARHVPRRLSATTLVVRRPADRISSATSRPSAASRKAIPRPMPLAAPVTSATLEEPLLSIIYPFLLTAPPQIEFCPADDVRVKTKALGN